MRIMPQAIAAIRALEKELGRPTTILADLQGPKLRVGTFADGRVTLTKGDVFQLDRDPDARRPDAASSLPHREIFEALEPGARLLLDDGKLVLRVTEGQPRTRSRRWSRSAACCPTTRASTCPTWWCRCRR